MREWYEVVVKAWGMRGRGEDREETWWMVEVEVREYPRGRVSLCSLRVICVMPKVVR